jgi:outer membrane protein TolC
LVYNNRRVAIQQAQLLLQSTEQEQRATLNNLMFEATTVYWYWVETYAMLRIHVENVETAKTRFNAVKSNYINGNKPAIDTLEALILLQNRQLHAQEAQVAFTNAGLVLSNYLWYQNQVPLELQAGLVPPLPQAVPLPVVTTDSIQKYQVTASGFHPEVAQLNLIITGMELQQKLYANNLLPELMVDYTMLSGNANSWENASNGLAFENYRLGVSFVMPLFLRKERSYLNTMRIKTDETSLKLDLKQREIGNKIEAAYNKFDNLTGQLVLYTQTVQNYQQLYLAEVRMFGMGESTLFLVNTREQSTIEARLKLAQMLTKYHVYYHGIWFSGGTLW